MNKIQDNASLHENTVQKVAAENIKKKRSRGASKRKPSSRVQLRKWSDGLDERIVKQVLGMGVDLACVEVRGPYEVIVHNNPRE